MTTATFTFFRFCLAASTAALIACAGESSTGDNTDSEGNNDTTSTETGDADAGEDNGPDSGVSPDTETETGTDAMTETDWPDEKYLSIEEVYELVESQNQEMLLINVSDEEFYNLGHIEGSLEIPWDTLSDNLDAVDPARKVVIYCRRGVRSEKAYDTLTAAGYLEVWIMSGGIEAWSAAGYPTEAI